LHRGLESHAELVLKFDHDIKISNKSYAMIKARARVLADILYSTKMAQINLRNVQYEERTAIARELHDSIAQSLSYMKIQTSRLQDMLAKSELPNKDDALMIDSVIEDLRTTMNVAYRHLRELISTFRITMGGRKFSQALVDAINEFSNRSIIAIDIDNRLPENILTVAEEIQLLHIIREGLSNVVRHSQATSATVSVVCGDDVKIRVILADNGVGLPTRFDRDRHHGMIIMQERVLALNGTIQFGRHDDGGTIISITFEGGNKSTYTSIDEPGENEPEQKMDQS
jgi:two-component system nitrate/nitrite sensor histidine kinase NarX